MHGKIQPKRLKTKQMVRDQTKIINLISRIKKLKWNWEGHLMRINNDRWTSKKYWIPRNKKKPRKRPLCRWRDATVKFVREMENRRRK